MHTTGEKTRGIKVVKVIYSTDERRTASGIFEVALPYPLVKKRFSL
jgi:hypothetical protein